MHLIHLKGFLQGLTESIVLGLELRLQAFQHWYKTTSVEVFKDFFSVTWDVWKKVKLVKLVLKH